MRNLGDDDDFIRQVEALTIIKKIKSKADAFFDSRVSTRKPFGLATTDKPLSSGDIQLRHSNGVGPYQSSLITKGVEKNIIIT